MYFKTINKINIGGKMTKIALNSVKNGAKAKAVMWTCGLSQVNSVIKLHYIPEEKA